MAGLSRVLVKAGFSWKFTAGPGRFRRPDSVFVGRALGVTHHRWCLLGHLVEVVFVGGCLHCPPHPPHPPLAVVGLWKEATRRSPLVTEWVVAFQLLESVLSP